MKTYELIGPALDWAVAKCKGEDIVAARLFHDEGYYNYSINWAQGGPIIERERITLTSCNGAWEATHKGYFGYGPTPLIAAMRVYVASKLGTEVEIPEELK